MADAYQITGGSQYHGTVNISGAKNVAIKVLIAGLLFDGPVVLENMPRIGDVTEVMGLITDLGATATFTGDATVTVDGSNLSHHTLDLLSASKIRTSFMFFAPLLFRFGEAHIPNPGGCRLGARPIDRIVSGMQQLGVEVSYDSETGYYHATMSRDPEGRYRFEKVSHTGTELLLMFGAISQKPVIIEHAALEPEIDDLIALLSDGGAQISRSGDTISVQGTKVLKQQKPLAIRFDRNEAATFAALAVASDGDITLTGIHEYDLSAFHDVLRQIGATIETGAESVRYRAIQPLNPASITTQPHPGFMTDWQPLLAILLTQAEGVSQIHERMFENRFGYVDELKKLGADIEYIENSVDDPEAFYEFQYDPKREYRQAIQIRGKTPLHNAVVQMSDLRAGATLAVAALIAEGTSIVHGAVHLERGYEHFIQKITSLKGIISKIAS